jgi:phage tail sheath gpL-like
MPYEAAANVVALFCRVMQDSPQLDIGGKYYPDMPVPVSGSIGDMGDYNNRDLLLKSGSSTVKLDAGAYQVQDLVTTYHPIGEVPLQYNYCRNLNLDWNVKDGYSILENIYVKDHVIVLDAQVTDVSGAIKPAEWKAILFDYFDDLGQKALINDPSFSKTSLQVQVDPTNPNRLNTFFRYKRTGTARIESTDAEAGF